MKSGQIALFTAIASCALLVARAESQVMFFENRSQWDMVASAMPGVPPVTFSEPEWNTLRCCPMNITVTSGLIRFSPLPHPDMSRPHSQNITIYPFPGINPPSPCEDCTTPASDWCPSQIELVTGPECVLTQSDLEHIEMDFVNIVPLPRAIGFDFWSASTGPRPICSSTNAPVTFTVTLSDGSTQSFSSTQPPGTIDFVGLLATNSTLRISKVNWVLLPVAGVDPGQNTGIDNVIRGCARCPGEATGDCVIDLNDLAQLLANFGCVVGCTNDQGSVDGDGDVDIHDLAVTLSAFGKACPD